LELTVVLMFCEASMIDQAIIVVGTTIDVP
jgi:hypothetical protein